MLIRFLALASVLAFSASAQSGSAASASDSPAAADAASIGEQCQLSVARNGTEVVISWVLPKADIKQFEICRNTREQAQGRGRVAALRTEPAVYYDTVADAQSTYWYWLKFTLGDGRIVNVGPVATPAAKVWTP